MKQKPELLSPAGNTEKLRAALTYGADAVYGAGERFGMRSAAQNFSLPELREAIRFTHEKGKKFYLTVNVMPRTDEYPALRRYLRALAECPPDALILSDMGVLSTAKDLLPEVPVHISTQTSICSAASAEAWYRLGASRVVLARELSLDEIRRIRRHTPKKLELEVFIHGSMCVSYSGRCLLSNYFTGRDGNRGMCAQPCRWHYTGAQAPLEIIEDQRPDAPLPLYEDERGTYIMSSKDLCMIEHIPDLMESGIRSFKIEGRMKSAYYAAVVTGTYRMAIDEYEKKGADGYRFREEWLTELESVSHREYATGYFYDDPMRNAQLCEHPGYIREKAYLATALSYDGESKTALFVQRNKLTVGEDAELVSPGFCGRRFTVHSMTDEEGNAIPSSPHPGMRFRIPVPFPVKSGDILRGTVK